MSPALLASLAGRFNVPYIHFVPIASQIFAVAAGGAAGALARFGLSLAISRPDRPLYLATLLTNVIGCFLIGLAFRYFDARQSSEWVRAACVTGVLGAFTTFSTFSLETMHLIEQRDYTHAIINIGASVLLGLAAASLGLALGPRPPVHG